MFLLSSNLCVQYQVFQRNKKLLCPRQSGSVDRAKKSEPEKKLHWALDVSPFFITSGFFWTPEEQSIITACFVYVSPKPGLIPLGEETHLDKTTWSLNKFKYQIG